MKVVDARPNDGSFRDEFKDSATNTVDDYAYDSNGNMIMDNNKNITDITYNHLNLPTKITFSTKDAPSISYIYDAIGKKLQKIVRTYDSKSQTRTTIDTYYLNGFQYKRTFSTSPTSKTIAVTNLEFLPTAEGYVEPVGSSYKYVYQYKDHLGNVRVSYDKTLAIQEENNYYPFGLKHAGYANTISSTNSALKYKYNGKELQDELGLNMYDYGARNYDPAIGRWMNIDPLAEKHLEISPYVYCMNNPVVFVDPDGRDFGLYIDFEKGTVTVRATYYTTNQDKNSATNATKSWNDQSGKFSYNFTDENGNKQSFKVNYELNVEVVTPSEGQTEMGALSQALSANTSGEGNVYKVVDDNKLDANTNGSTSANFIQIKNSKKDAETGNHEVGHSLGILHSEKGLMTETSTDPNRTKDVYKNNVSNTVYSPIGSTTTDPTKANVPTGGAGRATLHLQGTSSPSAPKTNQGYRKLRNGTVE